MGGSMKLRPMLDHVVIQPIDTTKTKLKEIAPADVAKQNPLMGKIVAVAETIDPKTGDPKPLDVKVGDKVLFGNYVGTGITVDGTDCFIVNEEQIFGIIGSLPGKPFIPRPRPRPQQTQPGQQPDPKPKPKPRPA